MQPWQHFPDFAWSKLSKHVQSFWIFLIHRWRSKCSQSKSSFVLCIPPKESIHFCLVFYFYFNLLSRLTSRMNFPKDLLGTQPRHLSIFERQRIKEPPLGYKPTISSPKMRISYQQSYRGPCLVVLVQMLVFSITFVLWHEFYFKLFNLCLRSLSVVSLISICGCHVVTACGSHVVLGAQLLICSLKLDATITHSCYNLRGYSFSCIPVFFGLNNVQSGRDWSRHTPSSAHDVLVIGPFRLQ